MCSVRGVAEMDGFDLFKAMIGYRTCDQHARPVTFPQNLFQHHSTLCMKDICSTHPGVLLEVTHFVNTRLRRSPFPLRTASSIIDAAV